MSNTDYSMFNVETIYPTGDFQTEPIWKLKVGSRLLTGQSTYSYDANTQMLTLDLSFKIPMSSLLKQVTPVIETGAIKMDSSGVKDRLSLKNGFKWEYTFD